MGSQMIQIIILAGIALFLILRLRNVLGTREGFEKPQEMPGPAAGPPARPVLRGDRGRLRPTPTSPTSPTPRAPPARRSPR